MVSLKHSILHPARANAYTAVFGEGRAAEIVLADLRKFCHGGSTTACMDANGRIDPLASQQLEGRRQVWLRIVEYLGMDWPAEQEQTTEIIDDD